MIRNGHQKFQAALYAALAIAATLSLDDGLSVNEGIAIALAFVGALGVEKTRNVVDPRRLDSERGAIEPGSFALGLIGGILAMLLLFNGATDR